MAVLRVAASDGVTVERREESDAEILSNAMIALRRAKGCECLESLSRDALASCERLLAMYVPGEKGGTD